MDDLKQNEEEVTLEPESLDEGGQDVILEEEVDDVDDGEEVIVETKPGHPPHSHVVLWISVAVSILAIMVGWMYVTRQSFMSIDKKVNPDAPQNNAELQKQVSETFSGLGTMLDDMNNNVDKLKTLDETRQKEAAQLQAAGKAVVEDLKKE